MHATIRNYAGGGALADALVEHEADIRTLITGVDGFRAYYVVRDPDGATTSRSCAKAAMVCLARARASSW